MELREVVFHSISGEEVLSDRVGKVTIVLTLPLCSSSLWSHEQEITLCLVRRHDTNCHLNLLECICRVIVRHTCHQTLLNLVLGSTTSAQVAKESRESVEDEAKDK